eukprot:gene30706-35733_t
MARAIYRWFSYTNQQQQLQLRGTARSGGYPYNRTRLVAMDGADDDNIAFFAKPKKQKSGKAAMSAVTTAQTPKPIQKLAQAAVEVANPSQPPEQTPSSPSQAKLKRTHGEVEGSEDGSGLEKGEGEEEDEEKDNEEEEEEEGDEAPGTDAAERSKEEASTSQMTTFKQIGVSDWLSSVCTSLGMAIPTQVGAPTIVQETRRKDVIGLAQTGSGKTAAFALPILQKLAADPYGVFAVVLTPTRELAIQIVEQFRALGAGMSLKECVVIGGVDMQAQAKNLAKRPHVVIATPGRLKGLMDADNDLLKTFNRAKFLVMDEADRLLDPSFEGALRTVLGALTLETRQTLLFSATMTKSLIKLQKAYEGLKTADRLTEQYLFLPSKVKEVYLAYVLNTLLPERNIRSAIIFVNTCKGCAMISSLLEELGSKMAPTSIGGYKNDSEPCMWGKSQKQRLASLHRFKSEMVPLLIATDVASRGLDIPTVDLVINYDLPILSRDYVHRVGRTARAGRSGWSLSLVTQHDIELVHSIEELLGRQLDELKLDEAEVLTGITKRAAMMKVAEEEGINLKKNTKLRRLAKSL